MIPAHWLPNRWAQDWSPLVEVRGLNVDSALAQKGPEWVVREAENFYVSLGFQRLPQSFWDRSSLYPVAADAPYKKNTHASAWHMDLDGDVRSLMSVEPNAYWFETAEPRAGARLLLPTTPGPRCRCCCARAPTAPTTRGSGA